MPSTSDETFDFTVRNQVMLERLKAGEHKKFAPFLKDIEKSVRIRLSDEGETIRNKKRLGALLTDVTDIQRQIYNEYQAQLVGDLSAIGVQQAAFEAASYNAAVVGFQSSIPAEAQILAAIRVNPLQVANYTGNPLLEPFIKDWSSSEIQRVRTAIQQGFYQGQTNAEITRNLRGTRANNFNDGDYARVNRSNRTLVRTAVQHSSTQARVATMGQNSDLVKSYEWVSTLDSRTSAQCFTGATKVTPCFDIEKLYRAKYAGEIITITLATGEKIEGTPNHPVLTSEGWTKLGKLDPSKHIVYTAGNDVIKVVGNKRVGVETTFSELYDSIGKSPSVDISSVGSSTADFYGDGVGLDGEIDIIDTKSHLGCDAEPSIAKQVKDKVFSITRGFCSLSCISSILLVFRGWLPAIKPSEFAASIIKCGKKAAFRDFKFSLNFSWPKAIFKHINSILFGKRYRVANVTSAYWLSDSELVKEARDSGDGGFVALSDASSGFSVEVSSCNIVRKSSEFKSCHVYTLQCGQGYYIAGGIIVKNCASLDGRKFKMGEGPLPPIHPNCRSTITPVLSSKFDFLDEGAKRPEKGASGPGQTNADTTYYSWLKRQPAKFQDDAIGPTRGSLLRNGGITSDEFAKLSLNKNFEPLTLSQLRAKAPSVFERAGL